MQTIPFRTSMFDTFTEKIAAVTFGDLFDPMHEGHPYWSKIKHLFTAEEYFDGFELQPAFDEENGNSSDKPYLISFEADLANTDMFTQAWAPLVYAPWTDNDFNPVVTRDTSVLGYPPSKAMFFKQTSYITLSDENIVANDAARIQAPAFSSVTFAMQQIIYLDFQEIQQQVVARYLNAPNVAEREAIVLNERLARWNRGNYRYKISYRLPDGTITTSAHFSVAF